MKCKKCGSTNFFYDQVKHIEIEYQDHTVKVHDCVVDICVDCGEEHLTISGEHRVTKAKLDLAENLLKEAEEKLATIKPLIRKAWYVL